MCRAAVRSALRAVWCGLQHSSKSDTVINLCIGIGWGPVLILSVTEHGNQSRPKVNGRPR